MGPQHDCLPILRSGYRGKEVVHSPGPSPESRQAYEVGTVALRFDDPVRKAYVRTAGPPQVPYRGVPARLSSPRTSRVTAPVRQYSPSSRDTRAPLLKRAEADAHLVVSPTWSVPQRSLTELVGNGDEGMILFVMRPLVIDRPPTAE